MEDNSNVISMVHYCHMVLEKISQEVRDMQNCLSSIEVELAVEHFINKIDEEVEENEA